jgi:hypothetical protein
MFRARILPILGLAAAVALSALPADAAQRGGRRQGGGPPPAAPPPDTGRHAVPRPGNDGPRPGGAGGDVVGIPSGVGAQGHRGGPYGYPGPVYGSYRNPVYGWFRGPTYGPYLGLIRSSPYRYSHPYYTFRPRTTLGVGFHAGFAVPFPGVAYGGISPYFGGAYGYPTPYPVPYPVPYPAPYGSTGYPSSGYPSGSPAAGTPGPPPGGIAIVPGTTVPGAESYGGVSIEVTPREAEVWVDGGYAGRADEFGPQARPLTLATGVHRVELRAPGYRALAFDVNVAAGFVVPFQGALQPQP